MFLATAASLLLLAHADNPAAGQSGAAPAVNKSPEPESSVEMAKLSLDDLIRRLPPVGFEWTWNHQKNDGELHPAAYELTRRLTAGVALTDRQWQTVLLESGAIRYQPRWPRHEDYRISLTVPRWLGLTQIRLHPRLAGLRDIHAGDLMASVSGTGASIDACEARLGRSLGRVPEETMDILFDVEIERGESWGFMLEPDEVAPKPGMLWKGTVSIPFEAVDSFDRVVDPVDSDELRQALRDAIGAGMRSWGQENRIVPFVLIDPDCAKYPELEQTGLDLKVELRDGDKLIAESSLVASNFDKLSLVSSMTRGRLKFYGSTNLNVKGPSQAPDTSQWMLRFTGCSHHIGSLWDARKRWSGTIEIPWDQAVKHESERVGPKGRGPEMSTPRWN